MRDNNRCNVQPCIRTCMYSPSINVPPQTDQAVLEVVSGPPSWLSWLLACLSLYGTAPLAVCCAVGFLPFISPPWGATRKIARLWPFFFRAMEDGCVQARLNEVPVLCIYACAGKVSPFAAENTERLTFVSALMNWKGRDYRSLGLEPPHLLVLVFLAAAAMVYLCRSTAGHCKAGIRRRLAMLPSCCIQTDCVVK